MVLNLLEASNIAERSALVLCRGRHEENLSEAGGRGGGGKTCGVRKAPTISRNPKFHPHPHCAMAMHSSILAWEIPWTEEPGGLQSMGSPKSQTHLPLT